MCGGTNIVLLLVGGGGVGELPGRMDSMASVLPLVQTHAAAADIAPGGHGTRSLEEQLRATARCRGGVLREDLRRHTVLVRIVMIEVHVTEGATGVRCQRWHRKPVRVIVRHSQGRIADLEIVAHGNTGHQRISPAILAARKSTGLF